MAHDGHVKSSVLTIAQELAEVVRLVEDDDVPAAVQRFTRRIVATVPGCDQAAITVLGDSGAETVAGFDNPDGNGLAKRFLGPDSPLSEVLRYLEPRHLPDAATDQRWPDFSSAMVTAGYRSCLMLPLPTKHAPAAALTLFSAQAGQFGETSYDVVLLFALHAGVVFDNAQLFHDCHKLVDQLSSALLTRQSIGRAQGILMHRFGNTVDEAMAQLKRASQNTNTKLREVASGLVTAQEQHELAAALGKYGLEPDELTRT
jgi:transcriptional regulator with GAF, ATPase, and Fis domain